MGYILAYYRDMQQFALLRRKDWTLDIEENKGRKKDKLRENDG